jgi:hypothetical protein
LWYYLIGIDGNEKEEAKKLLTKFQEKFRPKNSSWKKGTKF